MTQPAPLVATEWLSHGTLEVRDMGLSKRFYRDFLGLNCVRPLEAAQTIWLGGRWVIICVGVGETVAEQGPENRWGLAVSSAEQVGEAYGRAAGEGDAWEIRQLGEIVSDGERQGFSLQDRDGNWWEIYHEPEGVVERAFAQGDVT